jgi:hypothetical protein
MRYAYTSDGNVAATIDSSGRVSLGSEPGPVIGLVRGDTDVFGDEAGGEWLGCIDPDGRIVDASRDLVARVDIYGRVIDRIGRVVGKVDKPVDGAVLVLVVGRESPQLLSPPPPAEARGTTIMEEALELGDQHAKPGIRKDYKPLTDADVFGTPHKKKT